MATKVPTSKMIPKVSNNSQYLKSVINKKEKKVITPKAYECSGKGGKKK